LHRTTGRSTSPQVEIARGIPIGILKAMPTLL
jgi:hypothetical protein